MENPWISPKTALPKDDEDIIFAIYQGPQATDRFAYHIGSLERASSHKYDGVDMFWWGFEGWYRTEDVAFWMPLPELPKKDDEDGKPERQTAIDGS